jgi:hypothetical protein
MGGIPPTRLAHHAPLALMFSNATRSGDCIHSLGIAFPLTVWVGFTAITMPTSLTTSASAAIAAITATTTATTSISRSGELGLGSVDPRLINGFRALWDAMVRITAFETCINPVLLRNIPFLRHIQRIEHIVGLFTQLLYTTQTR